MKKKSKFDSNWVTGQYHFQNRGGKQDLKHPNAIAGYESAERLASTIRASKGNYLHD